MSVENQIIVSDVEPSSIIEVISRASKDPNTDVDKLERLLGMYERIQSRNSEQEFNKSMTDAQTSMTPIKADMNNSQTRSKYASYMALDKAIRPIYTRHGFSLSFNTEAGAPENHVRVVCDVSHKDGFSKKYQADMPADGKGAKGGDVMTKTHAFGSGVTYGMRYLLKMIFNIVVGDDDGNSAGERTINQEELDSLIKVCDDKKVDKQKLCEYVGVEGLALLTLSQLPKAYYGLGLKAKKNGA